MILTTGHDEGFTFMTVYSTNLGMHWSKVHGREGFCGTELLRIDNRTGHTTTDHTEALVGATID